jgi:threonine aldolase
VALHPKSIIDTKMSETLSIVLNMAKCNTGNGNKPPNYTDIANAVQAYWRIPCCIVVELSMKQFGGECIPWSDLEFLRKLADERSIKLHLDGTFIWEAQPYYRKSFAELSRIFDSIHLDFTAGMGAIGGSVLLGEMRFISACKQWRQRFGGCPKTVFPYVLDCQNKFQQRNHIFSNLKFVMNNIVTMIMTQCNSKLVSVFPICPNTNTANLIFKCTKAQALRAQDLLEKSFNMILFREKEIVNVSPESVTVELTLGVHNSNYSESLFLDAVQKFVKHLDKAIVELPRPVDKQVKPEKLPKSDKQLEEEEWMRIEQEEMKSHS